MNTVHIEKDIRDWYEILVNCPPTPPPSQTFCLTGEVSGGEL